LFISFLLLPFCLLFDGIKGAYHGATDKTRRRCYKNKNIDSSTGSSHLTDKAMMLYLVSWAKEIQKDMQNIMIQNSTIIKNLNDLMMYVSKPKQSSNNNIFGGFA
jgi:hypothetical protein